MCVPGGGGGGRCIIRRAWRGGRPEKKKPFSPPPTQSSGESRSPAGDESGERLDGAKLRNAKNLKDAVIATPVPPAGPWQVRPLPG